MGSFKVDSNTLEMYMTRFVGLAVVLQHQYSYEIPHWKYKNMFKESNCFCYERLPFWTIFRHWILYTSSILVAEVGDFVPYFTLHRPRPGHWVVSNRVSRIGWSRVGGDFWLPLTPWPLSKKKCIFIPYIFNQKNVYMKNIDKYPKWYIFILYIS